MLQITARALPHLEEDSRLLPMLSTISRRYVGQDYTTKKPVGEITADMIDIVKLISLPFICFQQIFSFGEVIEMFIIHAVLPPLIV